MRLSRREFGARLGAVLVARPASAPARRTPRTHRVEIRRFAFDPPALEIAAGDRVTWVNMDVAPHTATGVDGKWNTGGLGRGDSRTLTFGAAGRHVYFCAFHPRMTGDLAVVDA